MDKNKKREMKLIVVGDESKARENLTKALFDIAFQMFLENREEAFECARKMRLKEK